MSKAAASGSVVLVAGAFPPPVHGASRVTDLVVAALRSAEVPHACFRTDVLLGRAYHLRRALRFLRLLVVVLRRRRQIRCLYQPGMGGYGLIYQLIVVMAARLLRIRLVFHHHSWAYLHRHSAMMTWIVRCGGARQVHVVLSHRMGELLEERYRARDFLVVSNAAFLGAPNAMGAAKEPGQPPIVGHLSNLSMEKGVGLVLKAVEQVRADGLQMALRLGGPASTDEVADLVLGHMRRNPQDQWHGAIPVEDVPDFMKALDCFIFPSTYSNEALPLVVLEALREGTPVIAAAVGALPELLRDDWLIEPDAQAIGGAVASVVADPTARTDAFRRYAQARGSSPVSRLLEVLARG